MANEKRDLVRQFLKEFKSIGSHGRGIDIVHRKKNLGSLAKLGLNFKNCKDEIQNLSVADYCKGPEPDTDKPGEVWEFRKQKDFVLIAIDAQQKIRYERSIYRSKTSDAKTWEEFLKMDQRDFGDKIDSGQQVGKCMELADFKIINDSTLEDLYTKLEKLYGEIKC